MSSIPGGRETRRWSPTREQLRILEAIYNGGNQTPKPEQIQVIAAELRRHGTVAGINVFYWFKNRKARERRKSRSIQEAHAAANSSGFSSFQPNDHFSSEMTVGETNYLLNSHSEEDESKFSNCVEVYDFLLNSDSAAAEVGVEVESSLQTLQLFPPSCTESMAYNNHQQ
uniref:WUSCHEL-related homeobox protein X n=1 Tax=Pinus yunnanensis TaxID=88732 RepID=A0AAU6RVX4_PINYU